jgi:hypothetical protein
MEYIRTPCEEIPRLSDPVAEGRSAKGGRAIMGRAYGSVVADGARARGHLSASAGHSVRSLASHSQCRRLPDVGPRVLAQFHARRRCGEPSWTNHLGNLAVGRVRRVARWPAMVSWTEHVPSGVRGARGPTSLDRGITTPINSADALCTGTVSVSAPLQRRPC